MVGRPVAHASPSRFSLACLGFAGHNLSQRQNTRRLVEFFSRTGGGVYIGGIASFTRMLSERWKRKRRSHSRWRSSQRPEQPVKLVQLTLQFSQLRRTRPVNTRTSWHAHNTTRHRHTLTISIRPHPLHLFHRLWSYIRCQIVWMRLNRLICHLLHLVFLRNSLLLLSLDHNIVYNCLRRLFTIRPWRRCQLFTKFGY